MTSYLVLVAPSANRVYADAAPALAVAEAAWVVRRFTTVDDPATIRAASDGESAYGIETIAGVPYLRVEAEGEEVVAALSNLSATFAIFEQVGELLKPIPLQRRQLYPDDLVTIPKYPGKTNEQWSRLMLNVTAAATKQPTKWLDGTLQVLDPLCGRGTTLNLAMLAGYPVTGIEIDRKDYEAYATFITTWLREHRLKHTLERRALTTAGRTRGRQLRLETAPDKTAYKRGPRQQVTYLNTDSTDLSGILPAASFDVIVTDTPYGVQHGSHTAHLSRSPLELLDRALPGWTRELRSTGAIGLSYNRFVAPPEDLTMLLDQHGLRVVEQLGSSFRHRVDASIDRDLIVATKA